MTRHGHSPPHAFLGAAGNRLAADTFGETGRAVLLLHGGGQTRHSWSGTAQRLAAEGWRALSLDLRGHGQSDWAPDGAYDLDDFVGDLVAVVRTLEQPPVVVGASAS